MSHSPPASLSSAPFTDALQNSTLRPFWPLVYIAWADGDLTPSEIHAVHSATLDAELPQAAQAQLSTWLTPNQPPTPTALKALEALVTERRPETATVPESFVQAGEELSDGPLSDKHRDAIREAAAHLGVVERDATAALYPNPTKRDRTALLSTPAEGGFSTEDMLRHLDGPWHQTRQSVRAILGSSPFTAFSHDDTSEQSRGDAYREQTLQWCRELAERGMGGRSVLESQGDARRQGHFISTFDTLATFDLSLVVKYGVQFGLFGVSIFFLGTQQHHDRYLGDVCDLALPGCFAMTERGHGSNVQALETTATYDAETDSIVVNTPSERAHKEYIGNAARHGKMATVFAQLFVGGECHGVHAVLVPIRDAAHAPCPGVRIEDSGDKMGLAGVDNGRLWFDNVRVPRENLLNRYGTIDDDGTYHSDIPSQNRRFFTMLGTLVGGRVSVAGAALTAAKVGLTHAVRYAAARRQFGAEGAAEVTLLTYPAHQRKLLPRLAEAYSLHAAHAHLLERFLDRSEEDSREVEALAAGVKALATRACTDTLQVCREACGGQGYLAVNRFSDLKADTDVFATFEGDNTVLLLLVAKSVLVQYQRQFSSGSVLTILGAIRERAQMTLAELNPVFGRKTDSEHLRSSEFLLEVFRHREQRLIQSAASRMKKRLDRGVDAFDAFLQVQPHLLDLATAHLERVVVEQRLAATCSIEDGADADALRSILSDVGALYALSRLDADMAWFLENGLFEQAKARAIRREVGALCASLAPHAVRLVDGFGVPSKVLGPIAFADQTARAH